MEATWGFGRRWVVFALPLAVLGGCHRSSSNVPPLVINEVMAAGSQRPLATPEGSSIVDADGEPADWVEVYNPLDVPVNLAGYTLTTNPERPRRYHFPPLVLEPRAFVVVIADNRPEAGPLHADFRLSAGGETVYLFGNEGAALVDRRAYREMEQDAAAGRYPDGAESYGIIYVPTPGRANRPIGIKPPRFQGLPEVSPDASNPESAPVRMTVLTDLRAGLKDPYLEREEVADCFSGSGQVLPGRLLAIELARRPGPDDPRRNVLGNLEAVPQEAVTYCVCLPMEPEAPTQRVKITVENDAGVTVIFECQCITCPKLPLAINELLPRNEKNLFDKYSKADHREENVTPDWIEIYNYGDQEISIANLKLVGDKTYRELLSGHTQGLFLWSFGDVGLEKMAAKEHLLILADNDNPYETDPEGNFVLGTDMKRIPAYRTYAWHGELGENARRYRSTNFKISGGSKNYHQNHEKGRDSFALLDEGGNVIDRASFNFSNPDPNAADPEISPDKAFGRCPDASSDRKPLVYQIDGQEGSGQFLPSPTPGESNGVDCGFQQSALRAAPRAVERRAAEADQVCECRYDVLPHLEPLFTDPRCPGPGIKEFVLNSIYLDQDTAAADTAAQPTYEVELRYVAGASEPVVLARGTPDLEVREPTEGEVESFHLDPTKVVGARLFLVLAQIPGQPAGTLVTYSLRARDLKIANDRGHPEEAIWVDLDETSAPAFSFRFKSGYQKPAVVINEVFPNADLQGPPLHYRGAQGTALPQMDYLELYNDSASTVDLSGTLLHDEDQPPRPQPRGALREFVIPAGTLLEPHGFLCIFFPAAGQEALVPADAVAVTAENSPGGNALQLDDCAEVLYLLAADGDGNCEVSRAQWSTGDGTGSQSCPAGVALGVFPDGKPSEGLNLKQRETPTPCASNCGGRQPRFSQAPLHFLPQGNSGFCPGQDDLVRIEAAVLIDAFAAVVLPGPIPTAPGGIREAKLLVRKGAARTEERMTLSNLANPRPPDECWAQVKLTGFIRPPQPEVTFYQVQVEDAFGNVLSSEEFSYGAAGTQPPVVINEAMADNQTTLPDERGRFGPWIEILNRSAGPVDVGGMFLTDAALEPRKWQIPRIPATLLAPHGCLIVFADGETSSPSGLHANFTLDASNPADLFLLDRPEDGTCIFESFHYDFGGLAPDVSIGRVPDGTGDPVPLPRPTPCSPSLEPGFLRADATGDGQLRVSDLAWFFQIYFFGKTPAPACKKVLDVNDDGMIGVEDGIHLANFLFLNGPAIPPPFPEEGNDPTPDGLPCP
jgi:hypothetical protein